ncbi:Nramp family divalent metal transporter [Constantimarinum furrinae]|uniref:Mn2+/Fe2+ transporter n=1 Tax=Constantimarinum furrinae TaxID=2562285 RepID=A0A7G8PXF7_9FLAO|nr:Nramp family divalent metal transporter [Constantimarinum furrinae]QNJ99023.1 Mn2+/Fe2+ transporter [Constantimarinum furrinae]
MNLFKNIGPGTLVTAAFIGPGTVTVCTLAGVEFGFTLLWAMVLSIIATIVLQEMAARLGLVSGTGLVETVKKEISSPALKYAALLLIFSAIFIGNAAYEAGNISGGVLGLETFVKTTTVDLGSLSVNYLSLVIGVLAFILLYTGSYKLIERSLIGLVLLMSVSFILTAILTQPDLISVVKGLFVPKFPEEGVLTVIGLIGTTVVPYNLFLHASLVKEKWKGVADLKKARTDLYVSIVLGGLVSISVIIAAAAIPKGAISSAADLALSMEPLFGNFAKYFLSAGLFAAGITSAITAPLAAAYVARGCFGWDSNLKSTRFRVAWGAVLLIGIVVSSIGLKPIEIIKFAQIANGILLPVITGFLLWIVNRKALLGNYKNSLLQNVIGSLIFLGTIVLGGRALIKVLEISW